MTEVNATQEKPLVVWFTASWCGGCKLVAPTLEKMAEELHNHATFIQVDAEQLETLCEEVEVDNFPHFRVYRAGKVEGDLTSSKAEKVEEFIRGLVVTTAEAPVAAEAQEQETVVEETSTVEEALENEAVSAEEAMIGVIAETLQEVVAAEVAAGVAAEDAVPKEDTEMAEPIKVDDGSKKRQEREASEVDSEQVTKKAKTEEQDVGQEIVSVELAITVGAEADVVNEEAQKEQEVAEEEIEEVAINDEFRSAQEPAVSDKIDVVEEATPSDHLDAAEEAALIEHFDVTEVVTTSDKLDAREADTAVTNAPAA
ncbi:hypothetical protein BBO99_00006167 [Phytophthora kernoviae]|uniref:Thioredoxin domain-containing protein n=2 Tax=Phytophthora kernoviae TaxID=325452 RepID=A0A421EXP0_9STRA|nr:hypothetical protein JM18_006449 [Phytophthora kernoviae]KAG2524586.1 hypothetical protein JM16_003611 [Phytophthora kernoviae]RLN10196.1 hypothetical protein BBI17_004103 [Phytophthora kernoviae]RLN78165.1 hypothetical protein BBO99_00006167 [Phytophthora kernoviae]